MSIKLVTFDALHTLITPRRPIYVQYSEVFAPSLGVLSPRELERSFKASLKQVQKDRPAYGGQLGAHEWWSEVIKRTAIGAGANPQAVETSLKGIVSRLMDRFSSSQGYRLFDDSLPARMSRAFAAAFSAPLMRKPQCKNAALAISPINGTVTGLVLADLGISSFLHPLVLSEEEGIEKPDAEIFRRTFRRALDSTNRFDQVVHVGDELECDYCGAQAAGMQALLIRRPSPEGDQEHKQADEDLGNVGVASGLHEVVEWVRSQNVA